jgi:hypothetical protein
MTIADFLKIEGNDFSKNLLLEAIITRSKVNQTERREFNFNVFSVIIDFEKDEVIISDDVCPDDNPPISVPIEDFHNTIRNFMP